MSMSIPAIASHPPPAEGWCRMLSFDPGSTFMGWAVIDYNVTLKQCIVLAAGSWHGDRLLKYYKSLTPTFIKQYCLMVAIEEQCLSLALAWSPTRIGSESAFLGRLPQVFISLSMAIMAIRRAAHRYGNMDCILVSPMETKAMVTTNHIADKDEMRAKINTLSDLIFVDGLSVDDLSEHAIDAIGHGYTSIKYTDFGIPRTPKVKKRKGRKFKKKRR